jgi:hypothetical protein
MTKFASGRLLHHTDRFDSEYAWELHAPRTSVLDKNGKLSLGGSNPVSTTADATLC